MGITRKSYKFYSPEREATVVFDGVNYVINSIDLGYVDTNFTTYAGAGQNGKTITSRVYGTRDVTIKGYILANSEEEMALYKKRLQLITAPMSDFQIIVNNKMVLTTTATTSIAYSTKFYENNEQLAYFEIECVSYSPFYEPVDGSVKVDIASWVKDFHFVYSNPVGEKFTFGHRNPSKVASITNEGEVKSGLKITFKAINGDVVNPYITNLTTNEKLLLNETIESGEEVVINTDYANKTCRNIDKDENWLNKLDLGSTFLQIGLGESVFTYGCGEDSDGTMSCSIEYTPKYMAV